MFEGRLAERREKMSSRSRESFHIFRVQGRFLGRCCRIAVSSVDGMRRLSPFYVNNDQIGITKVGWMIIIHISHACISVCDGLQRRAAPNRTNSRGHSTTC